MNSADFRYKIILQVKSETKTSYGNTNTWEDFKEIYSSMKYISGSKTNFNDTIFNTKSLSFMIYFNRWISEDMRIKYNDQFYKFTIEPIGYNQFLKLNAEKIDGK